MVGLWYNFHKCLLLLLNMCIDIQKSLAHMWEPIIESKRSRLIIRFYILITFSPPIKSLNPSRFLISIDLNNLENVWERNAVCFNIFLIKRNLFLAPPQTVREVVMCQIWWVYKRFKVLTKTLWKFLILTHNHHKISHSHT